MIFANPAYDVTHNKGAPPPEDSPYASVRKPWSLIGRYHADPVLDVMFAPIGPQHVITVGHIAGGITPGLPIDMQGILYSVISVEISAKTVYGLDPFGAPIPFGIDAAYVKLDKPIPQWFRRFKDIDLPNTGLHSLILCIGGGRGGQVASNPAVNEGWPTAVVEPDYVISTGNRWSIQRCDRLGDVTNFPINANPAQPDPPKWLSAGCIFRPHDDPQGHPECATIADQDSSSPCFINCGSSDDPWVFLGCVSGGGSSVITGYHDQILPGVQCSMCYLDNAHIAQLNNEPPPAPVYPKTDPIYITLQATVGIKGKPYIKTFNASIPRL